MSEPRRGQRWLIFLWLLAGLAVVALIMEGPNRTAPADAPAAMRESNPPSSPTVAPPRSEERSLSDCAEAGEIVMVRDSAGNVRLACRPQGFGGQ